MLLGFIGSGSWLVLITCSALFTFLIMQRIIARDFHFE